MLNRKDATLSQKLKGKSEKEQGLKNKEQGIKIEEIRSKGLELLCNVFGSIAQIAAEILFVLLLSF